MGIVVFRRTLHRAPNSRVEEVMPYKGISETEGVKRLLILLLLKMGTPSKEIGMALDIHSSIIRRMFPGRTIKKLKNFQ